MARPKAVTPDDVTGGGQLRVAGAGRVHGDGHVGAALGGERVRERAVARREQREPEGGGGGGDEQHDRDDDRLRPCGGASRRTRSAPGRASCRPGPRPAGAGPGSLRPRGQGGAAAHWCAPAAPGGRAVGDLAVHDLDRAGRVPGGERRVVGDEDQRLAGRVQLAQQAADLLAGGGVERPGGLVREQQLGRVDQRPGDRDALPLAARQPRRVGVALVGQAHPVEQLGRPRPGPPPGRAGQLGGQQHVVGDGQVVEEVEELEDDADVPGAEPGEGALPQVSMRCPATVTVPAVGRSSPAMRLSRVDFPDPDGPMIAATSPAATRDADLGQRGPAALLVGLGHAPLVGLGHVVQPDHRGVPGCGARRAGLVLLSSHRSPLRVSA